MQNRRRSSRVLHGCTSARHVVSRLHRSAVTQTMGLSDAALWKCCADPAWVRSLSAPISGSATRATVREGPDRSFGDGRPCIRISRTS